MPKRIILKEVDLNLGSNPPNSYKFLGFNGNELSERTGEVVTAIGGSGGLQGTNYIVVKSDGTPTENAAELQAAYDFAKTQSPSATNRWTVVVAPGKFQFTTNFIVDTEFIDIVSLTGNRDVIFIGGFDYYNAPDGDVDNCATISVEADNVLIKGIDVANGDIIASEGYNEKPFLIKANLPNTVIENCKSGAVGFGVYHGDDYEPEGSTLSSTFINNDGGSECFGSGANITGRFEGNNAINFCFGGFGGGDVNGIFINNKCSGNRNFGYNVSGNVISTFEGNYSGYQSFAVNVTGDVDIIVNNNRAEFNSFARTVEGFATVKGRDNNYSSGSWCVNVIGSIILELDNCRRFATNSGISPNSIGGNTTVKLKNCDALEIVPEADGFTSGTIEYCTATNNLGGGGLVVSFCKAGTILAPTGTGAIYASIDSTGFIAEELP
jgi:hypothetical protein